MDLATWLAQWPTIREALAVQVETAGSEGRIYPNHGRSTLREVDAALLHLAALAALVGSPRTGDKAPPATLTLVKGGKHGGKGKGRQ